MKLNYALVLTASGYAAALPGMKEPAGHEWQRRASDSRSPCPGLNVLANHGYLPRDGRNINKTILSKAATEAYGFPDGFNDFAVDVVLNGHLQTTGTNDTFHLGDLSLPASHNVCEFDGSLSRNDLATGDASHFDIGTWYKTGSRLGLYDLNYDHKHVFNSGGNGTNPGPAAYVSVETAARARSMHYAEDMAANKDFSVGIVNGSVGTTAFYLFTLWDDATQSVPKSWVRSFFGKLFLLLVFVMGTRAGANKGTWVLEEERIPYTWGFPSPGAPKRGEHMLELVNQVYAIGTGGQ
ncbi:Chloroperoxidase [Apiospora saccharicola]|uniref:Chloroperoxidase n=1 Tax=Apiospora saccharicola TaxID=335842 RepID=A0ABR1VK47_9PEZI